MATPLRNMITTQIQLLETVKTKRVAELSILQHRLENLQGLRNKLLNDEQLLETVEETVKLLSEAGVVS